jgi:hypothetical protein
MGRQKSDDRVVPKGRRKATSSDESRGGKAVTVEEKADQLALFVETAESSKEARRKVGAGVPAKKSMRVRGLRTRGGGTAEHSHLSIDPWLTSWQHIRAGRGLQVPITLAIVPRPSPPRRGPPQPALKPALILAEDILRERRVTGPTAGKKASGSRRSQMAC